MQQIIIIFHILFCIALVALVLLQHGKGADIGAAFGSGASQTIFGSQGSAPFLFKLTATFAGLFFATSLVLGYLAGKTSHQQENSILPISSPNTEQVIPLQNNALPANGETKANQNGDNNQNPSDNPTSKK